MGEGFGMDGSTTGKFVVVAGMLVPPGSFVGDAVGDAVSMETIVRGEPQAPE